MLRYLLTEPRDALACYFDRARCRLLRIHGRGCRGRTDHQPIPPGRWVSWP